MNDLIARLEAASGPDREIDVAIWSALLADPATYRLTPPGRPRYSKWESKHKGEWGAFYPFLNVKHYTASIDAALTLVPEGFRWKLGYSRHVPCNAELVDYRVQMEPNLGRFDGEADSNHAITLCIAALKARAVQQSIAPIAGQSGGQADA